MYSSPEEGALLKALLTNPAEENSLILWQYIKELKYEVGFRLVQY